MGEIVWYLTAVQVQGEDVVVRTVHPKALTEEARATIEALVFAHVVPLNLVPVPVAPPVAAQPNRLVETLPEETGDRMTMHRREASLTPGTDARRAATLREAAATASTPKAPPPEAAPTGVPGTMTQGEIARQMGFTGDPCPQCGGMQMVRTGTCVSCQACGHNAGCG